MTNKPLSGIIVLQNDTLPPLTLMASPDLFAKLTDTPEQAEAKHQALLANFAVFDQLLARHLSKRQCQQPHGEPVAWQRKSKTEEARWFDLPSEDVKAAIRLGYEVRPLYAKQPAPVALVPDGYCIMPRQLTAENGAKALLLGEFKLQVTMECSECCELEEPTEGCSICDGEGEYGQKHTIPWDKIKFIYSKAVSGLSIKQPEPATTQETEGA